MNLLLLWFRLLLLGTAAYGTTRIRLPIPAIEASKLTPALSQQVLSTHGLLAQILHFFIKEREYHQAVLMYGVSRAWGKEISRLLMVAASESLDDLKSFLAEWPFPIDLHRLFFMIRAKRRVPMRDALLALVSRALRRPGKEAEAVEVLAAEENGSGDFLKLAFDMVAADGEALTRYLQSSPNDDLLEWLFEQNSSSNESVWIQKIALSAGFAGNVKVLKRASDHFIAAYGLDLLLNAFVKGHLEMAKYLVETVGVDVTVRADALLISACRNDQMAMISWLTDQCPNLVKDSRGLIYQAVKMEKYGIVEGLLRLGYEPGQHQKQSPLALAIRRGRRDIARLLLDHVPLSYFECPLVKERRPRPTAFYTAIEEGDHEMVKLLIKYGADASELAYVMRDRAIAMSILGPDLFQLVQDHMDVERWIVRTCKLGNGNLYKCIYPIFKNRRDDEEYEEIQDRIEAAKRYCFRIEKVRKDVSRLSPPGPE